MQNEYPNGALALVNKGEQLLVYLARQNNFDIGMHLDKYEPISFKFGWW